MTQQLVDHGEPSKELRRSLEFLPRYIATVETTKHLTFQLHDASLPPGSRFVATAHELKLRFIGIAKLLLNR